MHELSAFRVSQSDTRRFSGLPEFSQVIWLILEAVLSVVLFLLIIWWTMPRKRDQDHDRKE
ncbi:MAG: hypothetical protein HY067_16375 [Betaproteobacteria bacterium]|nr:hypothetical protein [Betaproteobacteria bacterium]